MNELDAECHWGLSFLSPGKEPMYLLNPARKEKIPLSRTFL